MLWDPIYNSARWLDSKLLWDLSTATSVAVLGKNRRSVWILWLKLAEQFWFGDSEWKWKLPGGDCCGCDSCSVYRVTVFGAVR
jgi:hypothetical protein